MKRRICGTSDSEYFKAAKHCARETVKGLKNIENLHHRILSSPPPGWSFHYVEDSLRLCKHSSKNSEVLMTVKIDSELRISVSILGQPLNENHIIKKEIPSKIYCELEIREFLTLLDNWNICNGNNDETFKGLNLSTSKYIYVTSALHHVDCELLMTKKNPIRCMNCSRLRKSLRANKKQKEKQKDRTTKKTKNIRHMSLQEIRTKLKQAKAEKLLIAAKHKRLKSKLIYGVI